MKHGSYSTYVNYQCRCARCTEAARSYHRDLRAKKRARLTTATIQPKHGTPNTYANHGCRCGPCRESWRVYSAARRTQQAS